MSTTNTLTSTLTKKYPRSILMNKNREQPRTAPSNEASLIQAGSLLDESYQVNNPTVSCTTHHLVDYQQQPPISLQPTNYPTILNQPVLNPTSSNQPIIYESQLTYNPATGQHEQQLITCDQFYDHLTGGEPATLEYTGCLSSLVSHDFQLSISCWRRRLLILILIVNAVMAIVNAAIIVWIISYYYLSFNRVVDYSGNKIIVRVDAQFEKSLQLNSLSSIENEPLRISSDNIVVCDGRTQASLSLSKTGQIIGQADEIQLSDKQGEPQLMINENQFFSKIEKVTINNDHQLNLGKSVQTRQLTSQSSLKIVSLNRKLQVETSGLISVKSKNNLNLINNSTDHLQLITRSGRIQLNATVIEIANLRSFIPSKSGTSYSDIHQLCICKTNGRLFSDTADGHCLADRSICQT